MISLKDFSNISWVNWGNTISTQSDADKNIFLKNFDILDKKVNIATRTLDYYDLYKFVGSVDSQDAYRIAYASLANNRALAVVDDFDDYHAGDIILKDDFGEEIHIPTKQAGIFVPSHWEYQNNPARLCLTYTVYSSENQLPTQAVNPGDIAYSNSQAEIELPILQGESLYTVYYQNNSSTVYTHSFRANLDSHDNVIYPMIKFYNETGEEVYYDGVSMETDELTSEISFVIDIPPYCTAIGR